MPSKVDANSSSVLRIGISPWDTMNPSCFHNHTHPCRPGAELELLELILKTLPINITFELIITHEKGCGWPQNGVWKGLSGMLMNNSIDIIGNLCDMSDPERFENFGFSVPVWLYKQAYLLKVPDPVARFNPLAPLAKNVWRSFMLIMAMWFAFVWSRNILIYRFSLRGSTKKSAKEMFNFSFGFLDPETGRLYWFVWLCFLGYMLVVYNTYIKTALLYTYPLVRPFDDVFQLSEKLLDGSNYLLDYNNPASTPTCAEASCDTIKQAIQLGHYHYSNRSDGVALAQALSEDSKLVLAKGKIFLDTYLSDFPDRELFWLIEDDSMSEKWSAFLWRKNFTYQHQFDKMLTDMGDFKINIRSRYVKMFGTRPHMDTSIKPTVKDEDPFSLDRCIGIFYTLIGGIAISIFDFLLELIINKLLFNRIKI